jgi:glycerol-3-phosphate dehydrogenase
MSEQVQATATMETPVEQQAVNTPTANRQQTNVISDPHQIAALVMARMNLINAKKDELTIAIKGLTDLTQQLVQAYAGQMQVIEQLAARVKALEVTASAKGMNGHTATPGMPSA